MYTNSIPVTLYFDNTNIRFGDWGNGVYDFETGLHGNRTQPINTGRIVIDNYRCHRLVPGVSHRIRCTRSLYGILKRPLPSPVFAMPSIIVLRPRCCTAWLSSATAGSQHVCSGIYGQTGYLSSCFARSGRRCCARTVDSLCVHGWGWGEWIGGGV
jgi:hypothetical protein